PGSLRRSCPNLLHGWTGPNQPAGPSRKSGSVGVGHLVLGVARVVLVVGDDHVGRDAGARVEVAGRLEGQRTEPRVRLDHGVDRAVDDALHGVARTVDRNDLDVLAGLLAGRLERGDRAEGHLVVLRVDRGDARVTGDELLHDLLALVAGEVTGLLGDDGEPRGLGLELVDEPVRTVCSYVISGRAEQNGHLASAAGRLDHRVGGPLALLDEVRA